MSRRIELEYHALWLRGYWRKNPNGELTLPLFARSLGLAPKHVGGAIWLKPDAPSKCVALYSPFVRPSHSTHEDCALNCSALITGLNQQSPKCAETRWAVVCDHSKGRFVGGHCVRAGLAHSVRYGLFLRRGAMCPAPCST